MAGGWEKPSTPRSDDGFRSRGALCGAGCAPSRQEDLQPGEGAGTGAHILPWSPLQRWGSLGCPRSDAAPKSRFLLWPRGEEGREEESAQRPLVLKGPAQCC